MKNLFLLIVSISFMSYGQTYYGYKARTTEVKLQEVTFECNNYEFTFTNKKASDYPIRFKHPLGEEVRYDFNGRVSKIGELDIRYDFNGRLESIRKGYRQEIEIRYDTRGRIESISAGYDSKIEYNYDYQGRYTGASGNLTCPF